MALRSGVALKIGGAEYIAPPLNLNGVMAIEESGALKMRQSDSMRVKIEGCLLILIASLNRNYPDITLDWLKEEILGDELLPMLGAVSEIIVKGGFVPAGSSLGEAKAGDQSTTKN